MNYALWLSEPHPKMPEQYVASTSTKMIACFAEISLYPDAHVHKSIS